MMNEPSEFRLAPDGPRTRVLHVVTVMNVGGLECRLMDEYRRTDPRRVQFDFYCCSESGGHFDAEIERLGGRVYHGRKNSVLDGLKRRPPLYLFLKSHPEYRIVHCHLNQWCGFLLRGAKKAGVGVRIAHAHTALRLRSVKNAVKGVVKLPVNRYSTVKYAVSRRSGQWLFGKAAVRRGEVAVLPGSIDTLAYRYSPQARERVRRELGLGGEVAVLHVGNFRPEKNHRFLLDVFDAFLARGNRARLFLAGRPDGGQVRAYASAKVCRDSVVFLGVRDDVPALLQAADVFVFPSLTEGFPGSLLEAQACGLPCVASDVVPEEVNVTGLVRRMSLRQHAREWAVAMEECLGLPRADHAEEIARAGYDAGASARWMTEWYLRAASAGEKNSQDENGA